MREENNMSYYVMETLARQRQQELAAVTARPQGVAPRTRRSLRKVQRASGHPAAAMTSWLLQIGRL
jgi:hypothetical protein